MEDQVVGADVLATRTTSTIMSVGANLLAVGVMAAGAVAFVGVCVPLAAINLCLASTKPHDVDELPRLELVSAVADEHVAIMSHAIEVEEWDDDEEAMEEAGEAAVAEAVSVVAMAEGSRCGG